MIFVTVGTHEQPFNRLVKCIDELKRDGLIKEDVFIQTGFSTYEPKYCQWEKMIPYEKVCEFNRTAHIIVTHGGPSSFIDPLKIGKIPIVVPRMKRFGEHVNDHQVKFTRAVEEQKKNIILVEEIEKLGGIIADYDNIVSRMDLNLSSNNEYFVTEFKKIVDDLMKG